jgi:hypothetical protein
MHFMIELYIYIYIYIHTYVHTNEWDLHVFEILLSVLNNLIDLFVLEKNKILDPPSLILKFQIYENR